MVKFLETPPPSVSMKHLSGGSISLKSELALPKVERSLPHIFDITANAHPDRVFVRQKFPEGTDWREMTYGEVQRAANGLAQWLINEGVGFGDSVAVLSAPSIEHAIAAVGIQRSGAAIAPISPAYSLMSTDFTKLKDCIKASAARFAIVDDAALFERAMCALEEFDINFLSIQGAIESIATYRFSEIVQTPPTNTVFERMNALTPDTVARIMYTSGSSGSPKATPQRQSNLTVTVAQSEAVGILEFDGEGPHMLEAMPFSHIMAGNFNFNNIIRAGGTISIDDGKPTPQLFHKTIANLHEISPHFFITVPLGYSMLCDAMEADKVLRHSFFRNLKYIGFGGAVLPNSVKDRLLEFSKQERGEEVPIFSFYGATEYLFGALKYWHGGDTDVIGLPLPGAELKLKPADDRYELWIKSPTMMPRSGYIGAPELSETLFDEDDFFNTGDAVVFSDPEKPEKGLVFAGRVAEDFKLTSGTFVSVSSLRQDLLTSCEPYISEAVICGLNESWIGALLWLNPDATSKIANPSIDNLVRDPNVVAKISALIAEFNKNQNGLSRRIGTALIMSEPLSFDHNEVTVKGNISTRTILERRAGDVENLFNPPSNPDVLDFRNATQ